MGYILNKDKFNLLIEGLKDKYDIYGPTIFEYDGIHSDTDMIRYKKILDGEEIEFNRKSDFSFKEVILPIMQTLFYFTEEAMTEPKVENKQTIILLRHCDMHGLKRLDEMYLKNGEEDYYYKKLREKVKFIIMGCSQSFENCFCVSMKTNKGEGYDGFINKKNDQYEVDSSDEFIKKSLESLGKKEEVKVDYVKSNDIKVKIPKGLTAEVIGSSMWEEYDSRCVACGRCNFVCPTCTCFTMQDLFYQDNSQVGERKRVWASCMVDGYTDVAGGHSYRQKNGERMRFKVLHKVLDFKQRFGYQMCVGCGRCDDVCPEYISFSNSINKLERAMKEVKEQ